MPPRSAPQAACPEQVLEDLRELFRRAAGRREMAPPRRARRHRPRNDALGKCSAGAPPQARQSWTPRGARSRSAAPPQDRTPAVRRPSIPPTAPATVAQTSPCRRSRRVRSDLRSASPRWPSASARLARAQALQLPGLLQPVARRLELLEPSRSRRTPKRGVLRRTLDRVLASYQLDDFGGRTISTFSNETAPLEQSQRRSDVRPVWALPTHPAWQLQNQNVVAQPFEKFLISIRFCAGNGATGGRTPSRLRPAREPRRPRDCASPRGGSGRLHPGRVRAAGVD